MSSATGAATGRDDETGREDETGPVLLAEAFVLAALDPDGTVACGLSNQPAAAAGVTGALVTELVLDGHVDLVDGRVRRTASEPEHPLLAGALDGLARLEGKKLKSRLGSVEHAGWKEVVDVMVADGVIGREKHGLGPTRHPVSDGDAHAALVGRVRAAAGGTGPLDARTATLLALAGPCQMLEVVAPARADRKAARRRIAEATEQVPAAAAVRYVIEAMQAAAAGGAAVAVVSAGS